MTNLMVVILAVAVGQVIAGFVRTARACRYWQLESESVVVAKMSKVLDPSKYGQPWKEISFLTYWRVRIMASTFVPRIPVQGDPSQKEIYLRWTNLRIGEWVACDFGKKAKWTNPIFKGLFCLGLGMAFRDTRFK